MVYNESTFKGCLMGVQMMDEANLKSFAGERIANIVKGYKRIVNDQKTSVQLSMLTLVAGAQLGCSGMEFNQEKWGAILELFEQTPEQKDWMVTHQNSIFGDTKERQEYIGVLKRTAASLTKANASMMDDVVDYMLSVACVGEVNYVGIQEIKKFCFALNGEGSASDSSDNAAKKQAESKRLAEEKAKKENEQEEKQKASKAATDNMLAFVRSAKEEAESAEYDYESAVKIIEIKASGTINLFGGHAVSQVADIAASSKEVCDNLYASYQTLVEVLDAQCRPLLSREPDIMAVKEVVEMIKWLNDESAITNNFSASLNGTGLGDVATVKYSPSMSNLMIEKFWVSTYDQMPGAGDADERWKEQKKQEYLAKRKAEQEARRIEREEREAERQAEKKSREDEQSRKSYMETISKECFKKADEFSARLDAKINSKMNDFLQANQQKAKEVARERDRLQVEHDSLGFTKMAQKKALKEQIRQIDDHILFLSGLDGIKSDMDKLKEVAKQAVEDYKSKIQGYLDQRFPYEATLKKERDVYLDKQYGKDGKSGSAILGSNNEMKRKILQVVRDNPGCKITDMMEASEELRELSNQRLSALVRQLVYDEILTRSEYGHVAYFSIDTASIDDKTRKQLEERGILTYGEDPAFANVECPESPDVESIF